jgi:phosphoenolpyruvate synthase/pyruvate phosphate dikinase
MSVVVQVMVHQIVAGTSFIIEISTGFPAVHIAASYGLGESVVSGEVTSDEWLVDRQKLVIIKKVCGSKKMNIYCKKISLELLRKKFFLSKVNLFA